MPRQSSATALLILCALSVGSCERERSNPLDPEGEVVLNRPSAPSGLTAQAGVGFIALSWQPVTSSDLAGYAIYKASQSDGDYKFMTGSGDGTAPDSASTFTTGKTTYVDSVDGAVTLFYRVAAVDTSGFSSELSRFVGATSLADQLPPEAPLALSAIPDEVEPGRVVLSWSPPRHDEDGGELSGLSGYIVLRAESGSGSPVPIDTLVASQTGYTDVGLKSLTTYSYTVIAFDNKGNSSRSAAAVQVTTGGLAAPGRVAAVGGIGRVVVSWDAVEGGELQGYNVYRSDRSDGAYVLLSAEGSGFTTGRTSYEDNAVVAGQVYFYRLEAIGANGLVSERTVFVSAEVEVDEVPPAAPLNVSAVADEAEFGRVVVTWSVPQADSDRGELTGLSGYAVFRSEETTDSFVRVGETTVAQFEDSGLSESTTYFYTVVAIDDAGNESGRSLSVRVKTRGPDLTAPAAPVNVSVVADEAEFGRVVVTWSVPQIDSDGGELTGLSGYSVFRSEETTDSFARVGETTEAQFADTGLSESTLYFYSVAAIDDDGNESGRSRVVSVTTRGQDLTAPATPANVSVSTDETDATRVTVRWNASVRDSDGGALTGLSGYVVLRSEGGGGFAAIDTVGADVREYEDTGLEPLTSYRYTVTAFDEAGNSSSQATSVQATTGGLAVPGRVAAVGGIGRVVVSWDAVEGGELQGYNVYRSDRSDGAYVLLSAEGSGFTTGRTSYEDTAVVAGQVYFYRLEAVGASGLVSEQSIFVSAEVEADEVPPAAPVNVSVVADETEPTRVTVRWNASLRDSDGGALTGLSGYVLLRSDAGGGFAVIDTVAADVREYDDTGLEPLTSYQYTVTAFDEAGNSSSQAISVQVTTGGLAVPSGVVAVGGIGRVVVSWGAVSGAELQGYNVYRSDRSDGTYVLLTGGEGSGFTTGRTSYVDSAVVAGQVYFYRVEAVGASSAVSEQSIFVSAEVEVDEVSPAAPRDLLAFADDAAATITLSWSGTSLDSDGGELTGLSSYVVFRSRDTATTLVAVDTLDATLLQFVDSGLASSTTYIYALSALDADGNASPLSASVSATTAGIAIPSGVNAEGGIKRIDLSWNASADDGLQGYNVYRSTQSDQGYSRLAGVEGSSFTTGQTTYIDSGLTGGGVFFYQVTTVTNSGESARSAFTGATVSSDIRAPAAPTFLDGEPVTGDPAALSLEWKAPTTDVGGAELTGLANYLIYRGDSSTGPFTQIGSSTTTSFQDDELDATTTYFYEVEALDDEGNASPRSSTISLTTEGVDVPKNVRLSATTPSDSGEDPVVTISWDASVGAVLRYEVQRTQVEGSENDAQFTDVLPTGVATTRTDSGVTRGETYYYRVRMVDSQFRESVWTALAEVTVSN